jgi:hypothetical protein
MTYDREELMVSVVDIHIGARDFPFLRQNGGTTGGATFLESQTARENILNQLHLPPRLYKPLPLSTSPGGAHHSLTY